MEPGVSPHCNFIAPERSQLFMLSEKGVLIIVDAKSLGVESVIELSPERMPEAIAIGPDSRIVYVANSGDGTLSIIQLP